MKPPGLGPPHVQLPVQPGISMSGRLQDGMRSATQQARWPAAPQGARFCGGATIAAGVSQWPMEFKAPPGFRPPQVQLPEQPGISMSGRLQDGGTRSVTQQARWPAAPQEVADCCVTPGRGMQWPMEFKAPNGLAPPHVQLPEQPGISMNPTLQDGKRSVTQQARWPLAPQAVGGGGGGALASQ